MYALYQIVDLIRENKKPFLYINVKQSIYDVPVFAGSYEIESTEPKEEQTENAISWLTRFVTKHPKKAIFFITMKTAPKANQSGVAGPFQFSLSEDFEEKENAGLNGIPQNSAPLGYIPESEARARQLETELKFVKEIEEIKHRHEVERLQNDIDAMKNEFNEKLENQSRFDAKELAGYIPQVLNGLAQIFGKGTPTLAGTPQAQPVSETDSIILGELSQMTDTEKLNLYNFFKNYKNQKGAENE